MTTLLVLLKLIHVIAAMLAVGTNATAIFWLQAGGHDPDRVKFAIGGIRGLDRKVGIPAFGVLLITGVLMVVLGLYDFTEGWILLAIVLYIGLAVAGMTVMGPALKRVIAEAEQDPYSEAYVEAKRTSMRYTIGSLAILLAIVVLMVTKPF